jgi:hypothetical protein
MANKTKLTPDIIEAIDESVRVGAFPYVAAQAFANSQPATARTHFLGGLCATLMFDSAERSPPG